MPSEYLAVRSIRLAVKDAIARTQEAYREIETRLKNHSQEFDRRHEALSAALESSSASLQQLQTNFMKDLTEELEKASQTMLTRSAQQLEKQADAAVTGLSERLAAQKQRFFAETEKQFEELRVSWQSFLDQKQKELATATQSSLDSLTKAALEKARTDLDGTKQGLLIESHKELASMIRTSVEARSKDLTRDLIEQIHAEVATSRRGFIDDTQNELNKITLVCMQELESRAKTSVDQVHATLMASQKQFVDETPKQVAAMTQASLECLIKTSVEHGRRELTHMVDEFLAKGIPQIESELKNLVGRHSEAARAQLAQIARTQAVEAPRAPAADASRLAPLLPAPFPGHPLEFRLAESAPKRGVDVRDISAGLASGLKMGLALTVIVLFVLALYFSSSPVVRLRANPPATFFDESSSGTTKQRAREDQLARSYWNIAVRDVETNYGFGTNLPADPPDSFKVEEKSPSGASSVDAAARVRYWQKLREAWPQSDSWERTSDWNLDWIRNAWNAASSKVGQVFSPSHTSAAPAP